MARLMKVGFEREATPGPGSSLEWRTGRFRWRYCRLDYGLNLYVALGGNDFQPALHASTMQGAAMFAEGFEAGQSWAKR